MDDKNVPLTQLENVPNGDLVHHKHRKYITKKQVKEIAEKNFQRNGLGINYRDIMKHFNVGKRKAQRTLKHFRMKTFLFTGEDLTKQGIHLKGLERKNPQIYYLTDMKAKVIESRKNNVQLNTTDLTVTPTITPTSTTSTITTTTQKIQYLHDWLIKLSDVMLYIHKLQLKTTVDRENYGLLDLPVHGIAKVHKERIGQARGSNVEYRIHTNGTIMIYISCSDNPFRLYDEQDISEIMVFLGRVEDRLKNLLSDTRDKVVPSVMTWILKACDVNKDVEIDDMAQLSLPDIQISMAEKAFRAYVKIIGDKAYYRTEKSLTPNEPVNNALERLRTDTNLDVLS